MISGALKDSFSCSKVMMNKVVNLSACKLKKTFKKIIIFNNLSVDFKKGHSYALMGESGSGKSTLMHLLAGIDNPTAGSVSLEERSLGTLTSGERAKHISFVVQSPTLITELTVLENIILGAELLGITKKEAEKKAQEYLTLLDLLSVSAWHVGALSGGQRQRIALIRALISEPDFLLADEPTGNLDNQSSEQLMQMIMLCQKKWNMGLIVSTHCKEVAQRMEVVFTLKNGILIRTS